MTARSLNEVTLLGNLGRDAEVRSTHGGTRVAELRVATTRRWNAADGGVGERVEWHRVVAWNAPKGPQFADICEKYAKKGFAVLVKGRIEYREHTGKDGLKKWVTEIVANELVVLGRMTRDGDGAEAA